MEIDQNGKQTSTGDNHAADKSRSQINYFGWTCIALMLVLFLAELSAILVQNQPRVCPDDAIYLQCAQLLLKGQMPYVDFIDINPPLIMYVNVVPVLISNFLHTPLFTTFVVWVWSLAVSSALLCCYILSKTASPDEWKFCGPMFLVFPLFAIGRYEYGQREHFFTMACVTLLLLRWARFNGKSFNRALLIFIGVMSGIAMALKPYFVLPVLMVELYWITCKKDLKTLLAPELLSCVAVFVVYAAHFAFLPLAMRQQFFQFLVPLVLSGYSSYNKGILDIYIHNIVSITLAPIVLASAWLLRNRFSLIWPLLVWTIGCFLMALIQQKEWRYHFLGFEAGLLMLGISSFLIFLNRLNKKEGENSQATNRSLPLRLAYMSALGLFLLFACGLFKLNERYHYLEPEPFEAYPLKTFIQKNTKPGDAVLGISQFVDPNYPLLCQLHLLPGSRYLFAFPLVMCEYLKSKPGDSKALEINDLEDKVIKNIEFDISTRKPKVIFIQVFFLKPLSEHQFFLTKALSNYKQVGAFANDPFGLFVLFKRVDL